MPSIKTWSDAKMPSSKQWYILSTCTKTLVWRITKADNLNPHGKFLGDRWHKSLKREQLKKINRLCFSFCFLESYHLCCSGHKTSVCTRVLDEKTFMVTLQWPPVSLLSQRKPTVWCMLSTQRCIFKLDREKRRHIPWAVLDTWARQEEIEFEN